MRLLFKTYLLYGAVFFLLAGCNARFAGFFGAQPIPSSASQVQYQFSSLGSISTYTCASITLSSVTSAGSPYVATANTTITPNITVIRDFG
jgi:hypothetical protein